MKVRSQDIMHMVRIGRMYSPQINNHNNNKIRTTGIELSIM